MQGGIIMRELLCNDLRYEFVEEDLLERLHCDESDEIYIRARELLDKAIPLLHPAFVVKEFPVDEIRKDGVVVGGVFFNSRITAKKLNGEKTVFVYIATCGRKINEYIDSLTDVLDKYILDQVAYLAYLQAMDIMSLKVESTFKIERHIRLCPGSIIDWSIADVKKIFVLMEGLYQKIDVNVLESGLINPLKSTSGLFYETLEEFESCAICPRANCENRRMAFDEDLQAQMISNGNL